MVSGRRYDHRDLYGRGVLLMLRVRIHRKKDIECGRRAVQEGNEATPYLEQNLPGFTKQPPAGTFPGMKPKLGASQ